MKRTWIRLLALLAVVLCIAGCSSEQAAHSDTKTTAEIEEMRKSIPKEVPQGVSVLMYHMIGTIEDNGAVLHPDNFREQMKFLKENNYNPITLDELYEYMEHGEALPINPVCITFDDGYIDNYEIVYPIMLEYGFPWTVFVIGNLTGEPGRMTWEQLEEMRDHGVTIANHTMSHEPMLYLDVATQRREVEEMQALLKEKLDIDNRFFCYPYGMYDETLQQILRENGIVLAVTMDPGRANVGENVMEVERIWIGNEVDMEHFAERLTTDNYRSL